MNRKRKRIISAGLPQAGLRGTYKDPFTGGERAFVIRKADESKYMTVRFDDTGEDDQMQWCEVSPDDVYISDAYNWKGKTKTAFK